MQVGLIILDGWGLNPDEDARDAVRAAATPNVDQYRAEGAFGTLETHGRRVGLPAGQMGNSEVGHLNIGAGRVVKQEATRITDDIDDGVFGANETLVSAFEHAKLNGGRVHFMGLVSDGGVHSYQAHLHALIDMAAHRGIEAVTHAFTDGRDTAPESGAGFLADLEEHVAAHGTGDVATVTGRYYAMDRDENWDRTKRAYDAIVNREADHSAASAVEAAEQSYDRGDTDEFVEPTLIEGGHPIEEDDAVVFFNFRADRARQLTRMVDDFQPAWEFETSPPNVRLVTMTRYDDRFDLPVAYPPNLPRAVLGETLAYSDYSQLRIAETEKYAHVTYFFNGGREGTWPGERREIVDSPDVPTYDQQPEMSAPEVADTAIDVIDAEDPDVLVLNFANPDMVGHTGDFEAAVAAVEAVDEQLGRVVEAVQGAGGDLLITADHGNADDLGTAENPHTAHTLNPVPFVCLDAEGGDADRSIRDGGTLADVAPTLLDLLDEHVPDPWTGESLLE